jgi:hypothetical protein
VASIEAALTTTIQAEQAFDIEEGVIESIHAGFTGAGYVNIDNAVDTFIWFVVNSQVAGQASVTIRYANGTGVNRPIRVSANGGPGVTVNGNPTGSWSSWATVTASVPLLAGSNDLFLTSVTANGMPNIDRIDIPSSRIIQAENAFDIDEGVVEAIHAGYTGTGYVNINNFSNTFIWFVVETTAATPLSLRVRYANGTSVARPIHITVNGANGGTLGGGPTGSWSSWTTATIGETLAAGGNDLILSSVTSDGMPNIDRIELVW